MRTISTEKLPIFLWLNDIEDGALQQAKNLANHPYAFEHIAIMPDSHEGFGVPIGGVFAAKGVVLPNAVGVDIGCGMCALKTSLTSISIETIKKILGGSAEYHGGIRSLIPTGFSHHSRRQDEKHMPREPQHFNLKQYPVVMREYEAALSQVGTLGGGNHFIEIQQGSDGHIWIMIHSGSRNIGLKVAEHYNKLAKELNERWKSPVPQKHDLAFLYLNSDEGQQYLREMNYCVEFALANRKLMMERIKDVFSHVTGCSFDEMINIAHNYAIGEEHYGEKVMVHRKGATFADNETTGIIPGSQGTTSYIVKGKGNPKSFNSCSHGAGRKMSRKKAQRELDIDKETRNLEKKGIIHAIRSRRDLDEAPGAYKDIDEVMANQQDLVEPVISLKPLAVIKG